VPPRPTEAMPEVRLVYHAPGDAEAGDGVIAAAAAGATWLGRALVSAVHTAITWARRLVRSHRGSAASVPGSALEAAEAADADYLWTADDVRAYGLAIPAVIE
jgi:hypothetical protein